MQELSILPGHLRSPLLLVGFVLWDLVCLGSVLLIMVWPFVLFILAIVLSVLDCFNAFMFQKYCFSLICLNYDNFNLLLCCTVQWWYFFSFKIAIRVLPIIVVFNGTCPQQRMFAQHTTTQCNGSSGYSKSNVAKCIWYNMNRDDIHVNVYWQDQKGRSNDHRKDNIV
jgi:glucan phosphoethanolaminetransferase (alkaline phosphatase superfamily)